MRPLPQVIDDAVIVQAERYRSYPWHVTAHAAEKYSARVDQSLAPMGARRLLERCLHAAELLPQPTFYGQQRWLLPGGDAVVVCKPDPKLKVRVAVTVLGIHEMYDVDAVPDVVEAFHRVTSNQAPSPPEPARAPAPAVRPPLPVARRIAAPTVAIRPPYAAVAKPHNTPRLDPWEQAYRALEKRYEGSTAENAKLVLQNQTLKQKHDPDVESLRHTLATTKSACEQWKKRARDAEAALRSPEALAAAAEKSVTVATLTRARRHAESREQEAAHFKNLLRAAIIGLKSDGAAAALATLEELEPGITGDQFCYPERFTKEERQAGARAAELAPGAAS